MCHNFITLELVSSPTSDHFTTTFFVTILPPFPPCPVYLCAVNYEAVRFLLSPYVAALGFPGYSLLCAENHFIVSVPFPREAIIHNACHCCVSKLQLMEFRDFLNYTKPCYICLVTGVAELLRIPVYSPKLWW